MTKRLVFHKEDVPEGAYRLEVVHHKDRVTDINPRVPTIIKLWDEVDLFFYSYYPEWRGKYFVHIEYHDEAGNLIHGNFNIESVESNSVAVHYHLRSETRYLT